MNNRQVAAAFADSGHTHNKGKGANLWFEDGVIYSYGRHFPIARFVPSVKPSRRVVFTTTRRASVTTSKHQSYVGGALAVSGVKIFHVDNVLAATREEHKANLAKYVEAIDAELELMRRALTRKALHLGWARDLEREANQYITEFLPGESLLGKAHGASIAA